MVFRLLFRSYHGLAWGLFLALAGCNEVDLSQLATYSCIPSAVPLDEDFGMSQMCTLQASDYTQMKSKRDVTLWGFDCVADASSNFPLVAPSRPSTSIERTQAFERISEALFDFSKTPSPAAFAQAQKDYALSDGIETRVARRGDYHNTTYPLSQPDACSARPVANDCTSTCTGPTELEPIINDAFSKGAGGIEPFTQAARLEAALIWFFYLSVYSEMHAGREDPSLADSARAYYAADQAPNGNGIGLSRYFKELEPSTLSTDSRVWDGLRALRCWREQTGDTVAIIGTIDDSDINLRWKAARDQLDRATLHGVALIVKDRLEKLSIETKSDIKSAHWAFVQTLGRYLLRGAENASPNTDGEMRLASELAQNDPAQANIADMIKAIGDEFPCP